MPVNVDTVYQTVQALANKEQRGYLTPQEFNLFANQAQLDIFEQYFYDLNQFKRVPGNDTGYSDMVDILEEKISLFKRSGLKLLDSEPLKDPDPLQKIYRIVNASYEGTMLEEIRSEDQYKIQSPLTKPNSKRPVFWRKDNNVYFQGIPSGEKVDFNYIIKPKRPIWAYVVTKRKALYNPNASTHFSIHRSDEVDLTLKISQLAGLSIKDTSLYQATAAEENKNIQQEKQ